MEGIEKALHVLSEQIYDGMLTRTLLTTYFNFNSIRRFVEQNVKLSRKTPSTLISTSLLYYFLIHPTS